MAKKFIMVSAAFFHIWAYLYYMGAAWEKLLPPISCAAVWATAALLIFAWKDIHK